MTKIPTCHPTKVQNVFRGKVNFDRFQNSVTSYMFKNKIIHSFSNLNYVLSENNLYTKTDKRER